MLPTSLARSLLALHTVSCYPTRLISPAAQRRAMLLRPRSRWRAEDLVAPVWALSQSQHQQSRLLRLQLHAANSLPGTTSPATSLAAPVRSDAARWRTRIGIRCNGQRPQIVWCTDANDIACARFIVALSVCCERRVGTCSLNLGLLSTRPITSHRQTRIQPADFSLSAFGYNPLQSLLLHSFFTEKDSLAPTDC